jgi:hypothetical protein
VDDLAQYIEKIQAALTSDLLPDYLNTPYSFYYNPRPYAWHCYHASEALYHLLPGRFKPLYMDVEGDPRCDRHWALLDKTDGSVIDLTIEQFENPPDYCVAVGKGFLTKNPSKRARKVIRRVQEWS